MKTADAIEELASAFCKMGGGQHKTLYASALHSIVQLAKSEQLLEMQLDFEICTSRGRANARMPT